MNSSDPNPKLPLWIFLATDVALLGAATLIALRAPQPLSTASIVWIVVCVGLGAFVALVPIVARYERVKNAAIDERQQALEALARTVTSSAEQLSIATNGLNQIADLALKNLRMAEHLPHKLQDKIAEFQAQISAATDVEKEELERELLALRTSESERLETVSQRIAKSAADWAKLEAATHQHLEAANEALAKLAMGTANAIGKAQAAAEQALAQARTEAARLVGDAAVGATRNLESAKTQALAALDAKLADLPSTIAERVSAELSGRLASVVMSQAPASPTSAVAATESVSSAMPTVTPTVALAAPAPSAASEPAPSPAPSTPTTTPESPDSTPDTIAPPKRPRKVRREEPEPVVSASEHPTSAPPPAASSSASSGLASPASTSSAPEFVGTSDAPVASEPQPVPAASIPEITPVVPATAEPFSGHISTEPNGNAAPSLPTETPLPPATEASRPARRRAQKPVTDDEPGLGLDLGDSVSSQPDRPAECVLSSDGATRLLVTAYIGIGNRLYIRGQGPGLTWEKGVPLQFVSIGKWRWETSDADAPVQFKLYKNDALECASLGAQSLDPGHQHEITAVF